MVCENPEASEYQLSFHKVSSVLRVLKLYDLHASAGRDSSVTECPRRFHRWQIPSLKIFLLVSCIHHKEGFLDEIVEKLHR